MKKFLCVVLTAVCIISACLFGGCKKSATVNYTLSEDGSYYIVSGVSGNADALTSYEIPAFYSPQEGARELPVKEIGESAFYGCSSLTEVVIPNTVTKIGDLAFAVSGLTEVEIPDSVEHIGVSAFGLCTGLKEVTVPESVTYLGDGAFRYCSSLQSAYVYANVTDLKFRMFYNSFQVSGNDIYTSSALTKIILPATLQKIDTEALRGNFKLGNIYFMGTEQQWNDLYFYVLVKEEGSELLKEERYEKSDVLEDSVKISFYSQTPPPLNVDGSAYEGNFWHYDTDGVTPIAWVK